MDNEKIRMLVKTREDIQKLRIRASNRLKKDANWGNQDMENQEDTIIADEMIPEEIGVALDFTENEKKIDKQIAAFVKNVPIYEKFLKGVKGCGIQMAAVLISEININKATTVSKIWQYAGVNPGLVKGKKKVDDELVVTDTLIPGDRLTKGFVCPYNKFLKTKTLGVLASCMIKSNSPYRKFYDDYKHRLENSDKETGKDGKKWSEVSKGHRDHAAKRYMIKMFLLDLYVNWRTLEGLEVREPYQQEYLGHAHNK